MLEENNDPKPSCNEAPGEHADKAEHSTASACAGTAEAEEQSRGERAKTRAREGARQVADGTKKLFQSMGDGLMAAGQAAEKLTRKGVHAVEIEKMRHDLRGAHCRLGEALVKLWQVTPAAAVTADTPELQPALKDISEIKKHIQETEAKVAALNK